jgi:hypothetical protein
MAQNIRELYNFICVNYVDGDDIILLGFSRGAFTARSVADLIASVGLLTVSGLEHFYHIFEDYENLGDKHRHLDDYLWHGMTPYQNERGKDLIHWTNRRKTLYRGWLKEKGYTRDTYLDGETEIRIKGVCVFETVGSLGVPPAPVIGLHGSARQWRFSNTEISDKVEYAFQALALDEPRAAFKPALWERMPGNRTQLKQVWFPGSHANPGGGWYDQQIATIAMAWMCDQLSMIGVEFDYKRMTAVFYEGLQYNAAHPFPAVPSWKTVLVLGHPKPIPWALPALFEKSKDDVPGKDGHEEIVRDAHNAKPNQSPQSSAPPQKLWAEARPWGLGQIRYPTSVIQLAAGVIKRHPGIFKRMDPETNKETDEPLILTNEKIHSCVRVRLAAEGLGVDDEHVWRCAPLLTAPHNGGPLWRLERASASQQSRSTTRNDEATSFQPREFDLPVEEYPHDWLYPIKEGDGQYQWVFVGEREPAPAGEVVPPVTVLPEEPIVGYWERVLLGLTAGSPDIWRWAEDHSPLQAGK